MKVLLCSPYSIGLQYVKGGIVVWAQNIVDYYNTLSAGLKLLVVPYDRTTNNNEEKWLLSRAWGGLVEYMKPIKKTNALLNKRDIDVVHLCTSASFSLLKDLIVLRMVKRKGAKSVIHFHFGRTPELAEKQNWEWKLLRRVIGIADAAITIDMKSYKTLLKHGFQNVYYLPNPLPSSIKRQIRHDFSFIERKARRVLFVGHVIPTKGVFELVEACKGIKDVELHIVGKVQDEVRSRMVEMSGGGGWLTFDGEVDHQCVIREMLASSIFVLPSYTEGFPYVIIESMACGCAIVATDVGAIPEMIGEEDGKQFGIIVRPKDVQQLKTAITGLLSDNKLMEECMKNAQERVDQRYAMPIVWDYLTSIWSTVNIKQ